MTNKDLSDIFDVQIANKPESTRKGSVLMVVYSISKAN